MADTDPNTPPADPAPEPKSDPKPADKQPPWGAPENFDAEKAWELIQNLRAEKGDPQKVSELEQQVEELRQAQQTQLDSIAKALGLKSDDTPPDPAKLTEQLTEEQTRAREAQVQLAVYRSPAAKEADVDGLLDSTSFQKALADVDPSDAEAVAAAVETFVEANPRFKTDGSKPRSPRPDPTQGRQPGQALDPIAADRAQIEADLAAARR